MSQTNNHDIYGLNRRIYRFAVELSKAQSAGISDVLAADRDRNMSFLNAIVFYRDWVVAAPQLDLPETHPTLYEMDEPDLPDDLDNESQQDLINLMMLTTRELAGSQSSRMASGLIAPDLARLDALVNKMKLFITTYVDNVVPLDLPESAPSAPGVLPGSQGI